MRIEWDLPENRLYSSGISQGVLYPEDSPGVPWNGLISVSATGIQTQEGRYIDGRRYHNRNLVPPFSGIISAFTYPDEFEPYIGINGMFTDQPRKLFNFSYQTNNEIHLVYNAMVAPSKHEYASISEEVKPVTFEWAFTTLPENIPGGKPSSHLVILFSESKPTAISSLEARLYGDDENDPNWPSIAEVIDIFEASATLRIIDNGDGTWTAIGPDDVVMMIDETTFLIGWSTVIIIDPTTFSVSSL